MQTHMLEEIIVERKFLQSLLGRFLSIFTQRFHYAIQELQGNVRSSACIWPFCLEGSMDGTRHCIACIKE